MGKTGFIIIAFFSLLINFKGRAQALYEKGYFVDNENNRVECLIKNEGWNKTPSSFRYKQNDEAKVEKGNLDNVKEFGIQKDIKFLRAKVNIDVSPDKPIDKISCIKDPVFKEEELFLKVIIEGNISLYEHKNGSVTRFFYKDSSNKITQLVYKKYLVNVYNVAENNTYKQQLINIFKCTETKQKNDILDAGYYASDLKKLFEDNYRCLDVDYWVYNSKKQKLDFNLTIRPGINFSNFEIKQNQLSTFYTEKFGTRDMGTKCNNRLGVEFEIVFPINRNKWSIVLEPTYQYYESEIYFEATKHFTSDTEVNIDYKSIELPIGLRYYMFLSERSKLFVTGAIVTDFVDDATINIIKEGGYYDSGEKVLDIKSDINFALGLGYKFNNRYSFEIKYLTTRDLLANYIDSWISSYETFSIVLGYTLF